MLRKPHSDRSACMTSTRAARAAGNSDAITAAASSNRRPRTARRPGTCSPGYSWPHAPARVRRPRRPRRRPPRSSRLRAEPASAGGAARADRQPDAELARPSADREREHAGHADHRDRQRHRRRSRRTRSVFSRSGVSTSARTSSSVAARSTGWSADRSRMMRVIGGTSA